MLDARNGVLTRRVNLTNSRSRATSAGALHRAAAESRRLLGATRSDTRSASSNGEVYCPIIWTRKKKRRSSSGPAPTLRTPRARSCCVRRRDRVPDRGARAPHLQ